MKYEKVIAERMKERMSEAGKEFGKGMIGVDQMNHPYEAKTSKRKELAKIAGTSEGMHLRPRILTVDAFSIFRNSAG